MIDMGSIDVGSLLDQEFDHFRESADYRVLENCNILFGLKNIIFFCLLIFLAPLVIEVVMSVFDSPSPVG